MASRAKAPAKVPIKKVKVDVASVDDAKDSILTRSVLSYKDVAEQPRGQYFVVLDLNQRSLLFTADKVDVGEDSVALYAADSAAVGDFKFKKIVEFHSSLPWYAVSAEYASLISMEQMTRRSVSDQLALEKLHDALIPPDEDEQQSKLGPGAPIATAVKTGQYL